MGASAKNTKRSALDMQSVPFPPCRSADGPESTGYFDRLWLKSIPLWGSRFLAISRFERDTSKRRAKTETFEGRRIPEESERAKHIEETPK